VEADAQKSRRSHGSIDFTFKNWQAYLAKMFDEPNDDRFKE